MTTREARLPAKFTHQACPRCGKPDATISGAWLRAVRLRAGLTLREMARQADVSAPYLCDIERNRRNCLPAMLARYEALEGK